jgi:WD40 repeat protein
LLYYFIFFLQRKNCEDSVCVYDAKAWQLVHQVELPSTDAAGVEWSPDSRYIAIWDTITVGNSLMVVDSLTGKIVGSKKWECDNGLGIKCVSWAPSGQFVAVGTHDARMVLLNSVSWTEIACLKHESCIESRDGKQPVFVYAESVDGEVCKIEQAVERQASLRRLGSRNISKIWSSKTIQDDDGKVSTDEKLVEYEIVPLPLKLNIPRVPRDQVNPKLGVGTIKWSPNGKYLATICDDRPHVVWIWGSGRLSLEAILLHGRPVGCISWRPDESNCLAIVAGTRTVFFWSPEESSCVQISCDSFKAVGIEWSPEGDVLQVNSKESFCCGFLNTLAPP